MRKFAQSNINISNQRTTLWEANYYQTIYRNVIPWKFTLNKMKMIGFEHEAPKKFLTFVNTFLSIIIFNELLLFFFSFVLCVSLEN